MKKVFLSAFIFLAAVSLIYSENVPAALTLTAQTEPVSSTINAASDSKSNGTIIDAIINSFKPSPAGVTNTGSNVYESTPSDNIPAGILIISDSISAGLTAFLWSDYLMQINNYNKIYDEVNNTTYDNYKYLLNKKKSVEDRLSGCIIMSSITAVLLGYTAADFFWLHNVFPPDIKISFNYDAVKITALTRY